MLRNNKGISLITVIMTVLVLTILLSTISYTAVKNTKVKAINQLYNDLRTVTDEVQLYYAKHNKLPISQDLVYTVTDTYVEVQRDGVSQKYNYISNVKLDFILKPNLTSFSEENLYNPNDYDDSTGVGKAVYYKVDLSKFDNVTLSNNGTYLVNENSKTIYYYDGIEIYGEVYHKLPLTYIDAELPV